MRYEAHSPPYDVKYPTTDFPISGTGTINLFIAGWTVKKFGPRAALMCQTFVPAVRVATQIIGVVAGRREGMLIIQSTQLITMLGGPAGYILIINIIAGEVVEPVRRTAVFGMLQGAIMLGQGLGYLSTSPHLQNYLGIPHALASP